MNPPSAPSVAAPAERIAGASVAQLRDSYWRDYMVLAKPRITVMILLTVAVALLVASRQHATSVSPAVWLATLLGAGLVASSAAVLNQWYERDRDSLMQRTQGRPLPSGRLTTSEASVFGWLLLVVGVLILGFGANWVAALVSGVTWFVYCWVYTPMKTWSWWNTAVGTLPGALPVMIGWTAAGGGLWDLYGWALTTVVILWQFPHFMSIAWLYRDQYTQAGFQMLTRADPSGIAAAWHAVVPAVMLVPLSMAVLQPNSGLGWGIALLGALAAATQVLASVRFLKSRDNVTAKRLLRASLIYLPAIMLLAVLRWVVL